MALSCVSHVALPSVQCSSRTSQPRVFPTPAIRELRFVPNLTLCTSPHRVRECGTRRQLSKSIVRAENSKTLADNENSRVSNEAERTVNCLATRTYRKALASLRVTGEALPLQVNSALAADGGSTAAQELAQGKSTLVIETYSPGRFCEGSTVSTKLQSPALSVLKRAKLMPKHDSQFSPSARAFAIAFQVVRLLKFSKFELCFFKPGTTKSMDDHKEGEVMAFLEVFDGSTLSEIAKGVCSYALACVRNTADQKFRNQQKAKQITTVESPVVKITTLTESEVLAHVKTIVEEKSLVGAGMRSSRHRSWWERPLATQSVVTTGVNAQLVDEFVPAHALAFKLLPSNNFEAVGLQKTTDDDASYTIHLTHAQMMDLADVLDLYCGDPFTSSGETVSLSIDVPRRSWTQAAQAAIVIGAVASAVGGALLLGFLSTRRARRGHMETPPLESIFDMAFSQKLRELREGEPVDEHKENPTDEQTDPTDEQFRSEAVEERTEAVNERGFVVYDDDDDDLDLAQQTEAVDEPVQRSPSRVSFRGRY